MRIWVKLALSRLSWHYLGSVFTNRRRKLAKLSRVGTIQAEFPLCEGGIGPNWAKLALSKGGFGPNLSMLTRSKGGPGPVRWICGQSWPKP